MTVLHAQTLVEHARRAREDKSTGETSSSTRDNKSTRVPGNSTRDLFCARLVGYLRAYDTRVADELALTLEMPELTEKEIRKRYEEKQA